MTIGKKFLTPQEVFNRVVNHLRAQGEKAIDPESESCRYRAPGGKMCAVGCLIKDEHYTEKFEGQASDGTGVVVALVKSGIPNTKSMQDLLGSFQETHDHHDWVEWEDRFKEIAENFSLVYTPVKECWE